MKFNLTNIDDNRNYEYSENKDSKRLEYPIVEQMVAHDSKVIDLGCGNGELLLRMKNEKNIKESGIEISESGVAVCQQRGLNVHIGRIDERLPFKDNAFDYAICNVTIQMVMYPEVLLQEMSRIARFQIVSFPNFGFWRNRIDLLLNGRMPKPMLFDYQWYSTGHIHQLSLKDFHQLVDDVGGMEILERKYVEPVNPIKRTLAAAFPNLFQVLGIYLLEKK